MAGSVMLSRTRWGGLLALDALRKTPSCMHTGLWYELLLNELPLSRVSKVDRCNLLL